MLSEVRKLSALLGIGGLAGRTTASAGIGAPNQIADPWADLPVA